MGFFDRLFKPDVKNLEQNNDVEGLIKALGYKEDYEVRCNAADALGRIGDPRAVQPLIDACGGPVYPVPGNAERALEKYQDDPRVKSKLINIKIHREEQRQGMRRDDNGNPYII
jgi:hypothetical protein